MYISVMVILLMGTSSSTQPFLPQEVQEYFTNYIINDSLGIIANAHTVFADKEPLKACSEPCIELARLFSIAVDFPKTGVPAVVPHNLLVREYPDFMEKSDRETYVSNGVIGKLFRAVRDQMPRAGAVASFTREAACRSYDHDMEVEGFEDFLDDAAWLKESYDFRLGNLMEHYGMTNEAEILGGSPTKASRRFNKYRDGDAVRLAVRSLRKEVRAWVEEDAGDGDGGKGPSAYARASACYHVTYHPDYWGIYNEGLKRPHFLSFPWCAYDKLVVVKHEKMARRRADDRREERLARHMAGLKFV